MAAVSILPVLAVGISAYKIATDTIQDEVKNVSHEFVEQQYIKDQTNTTEGLCSPGSAWG